MPIPASVLADEARNVADKIVALRNRGVQSSPELVDASHRLNDLDALLASNVAMHTASTDGTESRSAGEVFIESAEYQDFSRNGRSFPRLELRGREVRTLIDSSASPSAGGWLPQGQPVAPSARQLRFFVRDVLPVITTGLQAVPYQRELNPATNETAASGVEEGSAKPQVTMEFESDTAVVRKIAAWVPVTEEILMDAPTLRGYIDARLSYMLQFREQASVINGPGTSGQIKGLLQFSGVQTQAAESSSDPFVTIGRCIGKIEVVDGDANFVAMHPTDYWSAQVTRQTDVFDGGRGTSGAPFDAAASTVWGLPVIRSRSITAGTALVGDGRMGAAIFDRAQITIRQSDSHEDYFVNNKSALLAEERLALAVFRPDLFVSATL